MRTYTEKTAAAVIARMLKSKEVNNRPALQYTWMNENGAQCACDGYRAYRLKTPVPGLPDMPENVTPIQLEKVFEGPARVYNIPLDVPTLDDIKSLLAHDKEETDQARRGMWFFGEGKPVVNLKYLRDMLQIFPDAKFYWSGFTVNPLYIKSEHGDGLLLPVRVMKCENFMPRAIPEKQKKAAPAFSLAAFAARYAA